ncbi:DUF1643 domain-containing protein [Streptomyces sp. NPDC059679]|uniref:DUF1643 domain-containing protein n=1 Tax=Streptomyces sp. NPDC059679 TaxID=3346903 RepID=UPI0036B4B733
MTAAPSLVLPEGLVLETDRWDGMLATAVMDEPRTYRYLLTRIWDTSRPVMTVVMLNPSTADHRTNDPTITRLAGTNGFARRLGMGGIAVVNLFALRATKPQELGKATDPVGPHNDVFIRQAASTAGLVVAAWGGERRAVDRAATVTQDLTVVGVRLHALGTTSTGQPRHPLYLPGTAALVPYTGEPA